MKGPFGTWADLDDIQHATPTSSVGGPSSKPPATSASPTQPSFRQQVTAAGFTIPQYQAIDKNQEPMGAANVDPDAKCRICNDDKDPANLLVCESCLKVTLFIHTAWTTSYQKTAFHLGHTFAICAALIFKTTQEKIHRATKTYGKMKKLCAWLRME